MCNVQLRMTKLNAALALKERATAEVLETLVDSLAEDATQFHVEVSNLERLMSPPKPKAKGKAKAKAKQG